MPSSESSVKPFRKAFNPFGKPVNGANEVQRQAEVKVNGLRAVSSYPEPARREVL
jgi:hypothetical protein